MSLTTTEQPIQEFVESHRSSLKTPYYLIDESRLLKNLERIATVRAQENADS